MKATEKRELTNTVRDAQAYLDRLAAEREQQPDYAQLHRYLTALAPHLSDAKVPANWTRTAARLYFALQRYQDTSETLRRIRDPKLNSMHRRCAFCNAYYTVPWDWKARKDEIWEILQKAVPEIRRDNADPLLKEPLDPCFPTQLLIASPSEEEDGTILLGCPDGIYSLFPLNYLVQNMPEDFPTGWDVSLDDLTTGMDALAIEGKMVKMADVLVRATPSTDFHVGPKVDLELWHPVLEEELQSKTQDMDFLLGYLVGRTVSVAASLYVGKVSLAEAPLYGEDILQLEHLEDWLLERGMDPDVEAELILRRRVYAFTREATASQRPRGDILRGETCMPELEEIYFLHNAKGLSALQRYGVGCWFLILPKKVCDGDFPSFRDDLIEAVRLDEKNAVCFTGWAEGTRNYYIDFLAASSTSALGILREYLEDIPGGKDVRISTFYWDGVPRTVDCNKEQAAYEADPAELPMPQVSLKDQVAMEKAFRETQWEKKEGAPGWDIDRISPADELLPYLEAAMSYTIDCDKTNTPYNYVRIHQLLKKGMPKDDAPDAGQLYCASLGTVFMTLERYQEAAKWIARARPSDERTSHLYTCTFGSSFPDGHFQWENRRQMFWQLFAAAEADIARAIPADGNKADLVAFRDQTDAFFPANELLLARDTEGKKNFLQTGLPGGMLTLPAMLYLTSHYPANIARRWTIAISADGKAPDSFSAGEEEYLLKDFQVSLRDQAGTVSLTLWHPMLIQLSQIDPNAAYNVALKLVNFMLPIGARALYVETISVSLEELEDPFPLPELPQQMRDRGYLPEVSLDTLLTKRRYTITREPKDTGRPRDDILRGETCMPELEYIYNHLYEEGQRILERFGLTALFLMIPNKLCNGDPAQYRQQLQRYLTLAEGDKVFFTGWAEGTEYCYLDLISMHGRALLDRLNEYAITNPGGRDLRYSTFFWNCKPLPWIKIDALRQLLPNDSKHFNAYAREHAADDFPEPDIMAAADLEMSFQRTFEAEDFCAPKPAEAPAPAAAAPQAPTGGKKKLSKAQRKAQNAKNNNNKKKR